MYKSTSKSMQKSRGADLSKKTFGLRRNPTKESKEARRFWYPVILDQAQRGASIPIGNVPMWLRDEVAGFGILKWLNVWAFNASPPIKRKAQRYLQMSGKEKK